MLCARADLVTAPSRAMADALAQHYGADRSTRVITERPACEPLPSRRQGAVRLHRRPAVGRGQEHRGGRDGRRAAPLAGVLSPASRRTSDGRPLAELHHARTPRARRAIADWYARASIYALPARYEPFGLSALEAALSGCALVLGDIPSLREVWGDAALFVAPDDTDALAARRQLPHRPTPRLVSRWPAPRSEHASHIHRPTRMATAYWRPIEFGRRRNGGSVVRFVIFTHSLVSDWNHGNAHFLRGVATELIGARPRTAHLRAARRLESAEPDRADHGSRAIADFEAAYPLLAANFYDPTSSISTARSTAPTSSSCTSGTRTTWCGHRRASRAHDYQLFFHDTHHRSVTDPAAMARLRSLATTMACSPTASVIRDLYRPHGWANDAWTWHEAADTRVFHPASHAGERRRPRLGRQLGRRRAHGGDSRIPHRAGAALGLKARVYGVRYPARRCDELAAAGIEYGGWLANYRVPEVFARYRVTVHVPRRPYARALPGIPTIRPFEALACGIPLISAPWDDPRPLPAGPRFSRSRATARR